MAAKVAVHTVSSTVSGRGKRSTHRTTRATTAAGTSHAICPASWALNRRSTPGSPEKGGVNDSYALLSAVAAKRPRPL